MAFGEPHRGMHEGCNGWEILHVAVLTKLSTCVIFQQQRPPTLHGRYTDVGSTPTIFCSSWLKKRLWRRLETALMSSPPS